MKIWWIQLDTRAEKSETLKQVIQSLHITQEEKDLYIISIDILDNNDFSVFFQSIMNQIESNNVTNKGFTIEPLTSQII